MVFLSVPSPLFAGCLLLPPCPALHALKLEIDMCGTTLGWMLSERRFAPFGEANTQLPRMPILPKAIVEDSAESLDVFGVQHRAGVLKIEGDRLDLQ
jgi:hypothetical protein